MASCYVCDTILHSGNSSEEHIINDSIGGKLTSYDLLCKACNSHFGASYDAQLANELESFAIRLGVERKKSNKTIIKGWKGKDDEIIDIVYGQKVIQKYHVKPDIVDGKIVGYRLIVFGKDDLKKKLEGLQKRHPESTFDIEKMVESYIPKESPLEGNYQYTVDVGSEEFKKALLKIAVNFYLFHGGNREVINDAVSTLKDNKNDHVVVAYIPETPLCPPSAEEVLHIIHLVGDSQQNLLYCYVELFSTFGYIAVLSDKYRGKDFSETYCFNVMNRTTRNISIQLQISKSDIEMIEKELESFAPRIFNRLKHIDNIADRVHTEIYRKHVSGNVIKSVIEKHYPKIDWSIDNDIEITVEMQQEIAEEIERKRLEFLKRREIRAFNRTNEKNNQSLS